MHQGETIFSTDIIGHEAGFCCTVTAVFIACSGAHKFRLPQYWFFIQTYMLALLIHAAKLSDDDTMGYMTGAVSGC
jgi:hypothetical protein